MYSVKTQKTYRGRKAGGYMKTAYIQAMASGDYQVMCHDLPGCILTPTRGGNMMIHDVGGFVACLETSATAFNKLLELQQKADDTMLKIAREVEY